MPKLTAEYRGLDGIDLNQFPGEVTLTHGKDGEREWWDWWGSKSRRADRLGIIIQRPNQKLPYSIFFEQGETSRVLEVPVPEREWGVIAITFVTFKLGKAIEALSELGIIVHLEARG